MKWNPQRRRYVDSSGRAMSPAQVRKYIDHFILHEQELVAKRARGLLAGNATVDDFFAFMETKVKSWHGITGLIAYGGEPEMNRERWLRINNKIQSELTYLNGFQADADASFTAAEIIADKAVRTFAHLFPDAQAEIKERVSRALFTAAPSEASQITRQTIAEIVNAEIPEVVVGPEAGFLIGGTIEPRASMYPEASYATYQNSILERESDDGVTLGRRVLEDGDNCDDCIAAATDEFVPLDTLPEIGDSVCGSRCRCEFEFDLSGVRFATSELFSARIGGQEEFGGSVEIQ